MDENNDIEYIIKIIKERKVFNIEESSFNHYFSILKKRKNEIQKREKLKKLLGLKL